MLCYYPHGFFFLIDADRTNPQEFCHQKPREKGKKLADILPQLSELYERHMIAAREKRKNTADAQVLSVNQLRAEVLDSVLSKAEQKKGFYALTVPTGGGKTLASLGFALRHA